MIPEILLATALVALSILAALGPRSGLRRGGALLLVALVALAGLALRRWEPLAAAVAAPVLDRPIEVREDGYVSSDTCRGCHPQPWHTWHDSYHRTMTQLATPETVQAPFAGEELRLRGGAYQVSERDGRLWARLPRMGGPARGGAAERPVVMVTGSHHAQVFWLPTGDGRKLELFPFAWRIAEERWMPLEGIFLYPPDTPQETAAKGEWNVLCSRCHATHPKPRIMGRGMDTTAAEFGIACEACHGPAAEHVEANRSPWRRFALHLTGADDPTIVNPEHLPPERGAQVCGQCHSVFAFRDRSDARRFNREGLPYRPGDELRDTRVIYTGHHDSNFWSDGMVRTSGREYNGLIESPCYLHGDEARGVMTCTSCHALHREPGDPRPLTEWKDDQLAVGMEGDEACLQCHPRYRDAPERAAHTRHPAASAGSRCMNCHMPNTSYGLLKATRSHQVSSPSAATTRTTGRPDACTLCHLDRPLAWTAAELEQGWAVPPPSRLDEEDERVAAGVRLVLSGDAAQRALVAWSMGWAPAQEASGTDWMAPYLAQLLVDPYAANRFLAHRSLTTLPGYEDFVFDSMAPEPELRRARDRVLGAFLLQQRKETADRSSVLVRADGALERETFDRLLSRRDDRPVTIKE